MRHAYAAAVIRLVNGLVDPLQAGAYARPITAIAQQLGLPAWLVELRHAATHEDLPSLELLREAGRQSMAWLLHNYFLPTLHPVVAPATGVCAFRWMADASKLEDRPELDWILKDGIPGARLVGIDTIRHCFIYPCRDKTLLNVTLMHPDKREQDQHSTFNYLGRESLTPSL